MTGLMSAPIHNHREPSSGGWWCLSCHAPADLDDPGEAFPVCVRCSHRKLEWRVQEASAKAPRPPVIAPVPEDTHPIISQKRLRSEQRPSLSKMWLEGYWLCLACGQVTLRNGEECCVLCGSSRVQFKPPEGQE